MITYSVTRKQRNSHLKDIAHDLSRESRYLLKKLRPCRVVVKPLDLSILNARGCLRVRVTHIKPSPAVVMPPNIRYQTYNAAGRIISRGSVPRCMTSNYNTFIPLVLIMFSRVLCSICSRYSLYLNRINVDRLISIVSYL